jgi:hypothetical protein
MSDQFAIAWIDAFGVPHGKVSDEQLITIFKDAARKCEKRSGLSSSNPLIKIAGKYSAFLTPFVEQMEYELHANSGKGDRAGWLQMSPQQCLLEIYYHLGKLQKATKKSDIRGIIEYSADVANMCMMHADICQTMYDNLDDAVVDRLNAELGASNDR